MTRAWTGMMVIGASLFRAKVGSVRTLVSRGNFTSWEPTLRNTENVVHELEKCRLRAGYTGRRMFFVGSFFFLLMFIGLSTFLFLLTGQTWNGVCPSIFFCFFFYCLLFPAFPGSFSRVENRDWTEMNSESWVLKQKKKGGGKRPLGAGGWGGVGTGGIFFVYLLRSPRIPLFSFVFLRFFCVFFMVPLRVWNRCRAVGVHSKE